MIRSGVKWDDAAKMLFNGEGAVIQAYAVSLALRSGHKSELDPNAFLDELMNSTNNETYREKLEMAKRLSDEKNKLRIVSELGNGIEAYNSVPTATHSSLKGGFKESVKYAIGLGGDTDTIGAMTGAISGAYYGIDAIPER